MDLFLVRLAGARPPGVETLRAALHREPRLTPEPGRRGVWARTFAFDGGHLQVGTKAWPVRPETLVLVRDWLETGVVHPEAVRWARAEARRRFHEVADRLQQTTDTGERERLKGELARLRVGERPAPPLSG